ATKDDIRQLEIIEQDYKTRDLAKGEIRPRLDGLMWTPHNKRSYPEGDLASNILGFYSYLDRTKGEGFFGVEENYNQLLAGTPKAVYTEFDPQKVQNLLEVPPGADLVLTINKEIQAMVEKQLDDAIRWSESKSGTILVYNPKNGEVLAMATTPRLDPNQYWNYASVFPGTTPFNRAISQTYESGSVFKVITMASALDAGAVTPETTFVDTGGYDIGGYTINNWDYGAWGLQDMTGCMQHSLNVCLTWIAVQLGADRFYDYIKAFGFDRITGIDLAGEQHWPVKLPGDNQWYEVDLATNSFGQGISVTPIQMAMAIGAVANEGKMYAPHLVKSLIIDGKQMDIKPVLVGNPIKAETAHTLTNMLVNSLENEASDALVEGYALAGKTGTGSIPTEFGYTLSETNASFVGWGPADDPQFLVYIWLERPGISQWASLVAAPVFSKTVSNLVVLMGIPPDAIRAQIKGQSSAVSLGE
ncbi:MAG TPA: penicillin-binding protein 2, partial [Anaerolineaceae bacterium]|nr:penicillin-binding protein 2 [Anaerolineaceae bacterium]